MKKSILLILSITIILSLLSGCDTIFINNSEISSDDTTAASIESESDSATTEPETSVDINDFERACEHNWERIENLNDYTAVDKCSICGITRKYTDSEKIPVSTVETGVKILRYTSYDWYVSKKEINDCALGYAIIECLSNLEETGEISPYISDDVVTEFGAEELPVEGGTAWIDCGSVGLFRLTDYFGKICKVETHLGEGKVLQMTDTLKELLIQAWQYHPFDYWDGKYENGEFTLNQVYKADSAVEWVEIDSMHIENKHHSDNNKITLRIKSNETKTTSVRFESYQSDDNFGSVGSEKIELVAGEETVVELTFYGFYSYIYCLTVIIDKTKLNIKIDPKDVSEKYLITPSELSCYTAKQPSYLNPDLQASQEQAEYLIKIWNVNTWRNGTKEIEYDFVFRSDNMEIRYSYDEGIFYDVVNKRYLTLYEQLRESVNKTIDHFVVVPIID